MTIEVKSELDPDPFYCDNCGKDCNFIKIITDTEHDKLNIVVCDGCAIEIAYKLME